MPAGRTGLKVRVIGSAVDPCFKRRVGAPTAADCHDLNGVLGWFKAETLGLTDGAPVASWVNSDLSGNDASRATVSEQPVFISSPNGAPASCVRFDTASKGLDIPGLAGTFIDALTVHAVIRGNLTAQGLKLLLSAGSVNGGFQFDPDIAGDLEHCHITGNPNPPSVEFAASCKPHVMSFVADPVGGTERLFRNGSLIASVAYTPRPQQAFNSWLIGSTHGFSIGWIGDVWEIMLHSVAQDDPTVLTVGSCLASRYNLP